jgi:hypothetical protein
MLKVMAAIIQQKGKILICQRGAGGNGAFLWEFPGGKLEPGESRKSVLSGMRRGIGDQDNNRSIFAETTYNTLTGRYILLLSMRKYGR